MKGKAKWDAWTAKKGAFAARARRPGQPLRPGRLSRRSLRAGMAKEDAMNAYIETVAALKAKYA